MPEWNRLDLAFHGNEGDACELGLPDSALDYLRLFQTEAPDQLLLSLAEVLLACPQLIGTVIPLYASALSSHDRNFLAHYFPQAAPYLKDGQRAMLSWGKLRVWRLRLRVSRN